MEIAESHGAQGREAKVEHDEHLFILLLLLDACVSISEASVDIVYHVKSIAICFRILVVILHIVRNNYCLHDDKVVDGGEPPAKEKHLRAEAENAKEVLDVDFVRDLYLVFIHAVCVHPQVQVLVLGLHFAHDLFHFKTLILDEQLVEERELEYDEE